MGRITHMRICGSNNSSAIPSTRSQGQSAARGRALNRLLRREQLMSLLMFLFYPLTWSQLSRSVTGSSLPWRAGAGSVLSTHLPQPHPLPGLFPGGGAAEESGKYLDHLGLQLSLEIEFHPVGKNKVSETQIISGSILERATIGLLLLDQHIPHLTISIRQVQALHILHPTIPRLPTLGIVPILLTPVLLHRGPKEPMSESLLLGMWVIVQLLLTHTIPIFM